MSRMWWYTLGSLILWILNPFFRRVYDLYFGYSAVEILAILPLLSLTPHVYSLTFGGGWKRIPKPLAIAAWIWVGGFGYGLFIAIISGNLISGAYEFVTFIFPLGLGMWISADDAPFAIAYKRVTQLIFALATIISIYGVIQYIFAPPWDCNWLKEVIKTGATSFGKPYPFQIRVFSTLNDPGSFSLFLAVALLFVLPELSFRKPILLLQVPIWFVAFGLTLVRTGWIMFAMGTLAYLILSPRRVTVIGTFIFASVLVVGIVVVLPLAVGNDKMLTPLTTRFSTLQDLDEDESRQERQALYNDAPQLMMMAPFGTGLGLVGGSTRLNSNAATTDFDSGFLARSIEMGLPGLCLYIIPQLMLFGTSIALWVRARQQNSDTLQVMAALAMAHIFAFVFLEFAHDANGLPSLSFWMIESLSLSSLRLLKPAEGFRPKVAFA